MPAYMSTFICKTNFSWKERERGEYFGVGEAGSYGSYSIASDHLVYLHYM